MAVNFKTKTEAVYESLRSAIIHGKLEEGQKIVISDVSKTFGFSGIPVREAVRRLESEGLVEVKPHVGAIVRKIDLSEILEILQVRLELESLASKWALPHLTEADITALEKLIAQMEVAAEKKDYEKLNALNKSFHFKIYRAGSSSYLYKLIVELWEKVHKTNTYSLVPEKANNSIRGHKKMVKAIKNKDANLLTKLLKEQKAAGTKLVVQFFGKNS